jgi:hypothetical protein
MATDKDTEKNYLNAIEDLKCRLREKDETIKTLKRQLRDGVLCGKDEIIQVYEWSDYIFKKWVKNGLPCLIVDRFYYAHKDNISDFFKGITRQSYRNAPDSLIDDDEK